MLEFEKQNLERLIEQISKSTIAIEMSTFAIELSDGDNEDKQFHGVTESGEVLLHIEPDEVVEAGSRGCLTSCCFLGHGPFANLVNANGETVVTHDWRSYGREAFPSLYDINSSPTKEWAWLFGAYWRGSKEHCVNRAMYFLEHGSPPVDFWNGDRGVTWYEENPPSAW